MRRTLRRSCAACARSKYSCDLRTPICSRCIKRRTHCDYANEPLTAPLTTLRSDAAPSSIVLLPPDTSRFSSLDPFDSYPQTRLSRQHVHRLIHSFLTKIAFQYYPLDMKECSNPFIVSWWPLALGDPALFHVSLQTACLDEELLAQRGFQTSDLLMADSVTLLRRKVQDQGLAIQDSTMNSVITLAAIEFGKGNVEVSQMHIQGVRRMVHARGGIHEVKRTSPLTARMVSWVSMILTGHAQFDTQDDLGVGDGISSISEWHLIQPLSGPGDIGDFILDEPVANILHRLRNLSLTAQQLPFSTTKLHDLACFVVHRLLPTNSDFLCSTSSSTTEVMRYALILYMLVIHGTTYYPHTFVLNQALAQFVKHYEQSELAFYTQIASRVWLLTIGMVASVGTSHYRWLSGKARTTASSMQMRTWDEVFRHVKSILWFGMAPGESGFRPHWDTIFNTLDSPALPEYQANHLLNSTAMKQ
ncbi:hypothetical protein KCU77_g4606, partial [Aureobasidium melanogenum]